MVSQRIDRYTGLDGHLCTLVIGSESKFILYKNISIKMKKQKKKIKNDLNKNGKSPWKKEDVEEDDVLNLCINI